ncbi:MAG: 50S ribosomal protein L32e [Candidatus Aenigmatarchaeota archaeon]
MVYGSWGVSEMVNPRKKPKFLRQGAKAYKRLGEKWRRPRGMHSKLRRREKSKGKMPSPGYGAPRNLKHLHPSGYKEVLVHNVNELGKINPEKEAIKIAHTVGKKKREEILKKAEELKIKVLNP